MDTVSPEVRSRIMSHIRSESGIEVLPKHFRGLYLRKHPRGAFGNPDFGNKARRIVVFVDGCFWHGCPECYREPKSNTDFWRSKVERNKARDRAVNEHLKAGGWQVFRIREHELASAGNCRKGLQ